MTAPRYFFCFGMSKSGTTLLQRSLNLHPEVSCPSEHKLEVLFSKLGRMVGEYNQRLDVWDQQTGAQGATQLTQDSLVKIYRSIVLEILDASAGTKPVRGINDNAVIDHLDDFDRLFDQPTMIAIFRHPVDMAVSRWHRAKQLAFEEGDPQYQQRYERVGAFDDHVLGCFRLWRYALKNYLKLMGKRPNFLMLKYEDLVLHKETTLNTLFTSLKVDTSLDCIQRIVEATDFSRMKRNSSEPSFFRSGQVGSGSEQVSADIKSAGREQLSDLLKHMDYHIE